MSYMSPSETTYLDSKTYFRNIIKTLRYPYYEEMLKDTIELQQRFMNEFLRISYREQLLLYLTYTHNMNNLHILSCV